MSAAAVEVLLVEDNSDDAELTLRALRTHNLANSVGVAHDGEEGLAMIFGPDGFAGDQERTPKVILLDLKLPKIDGLEVLRRIRGDARTEEIPVVMLTSSAEERDVINSYALGVNSYIVKPVDFDKFMDSVAQLGMYWLLLNKAPVS